MKKKEIFEMTKAEFAKQYTIDLDNDKFVLGFSHKYLNKPPSSFKEKGMEVDVIFYTKDGTACLAQKENKIIRNPFFETKVLFEAEQMLEQILSNAHRMIVRAAKDENRWIPQEVLKEYPVLLNEAKVRDELYELIYLIQEENKPFHVEYIPAHIWTRLEAAKINHEIELKYSQGLKLFKYNNKVVFALNKASAKRKCRK